MKKRWLGPHKKMVKMALVIYIDFFFPPEVLIYCINYH